MGLDRILTLDCSTTCTGWALGEKGKVKKYGAIWQKGDVKDRKYRMVKAINRLVKKYSPDRIIYEGFFLIGFQRGSSVVLELLVALEFSLYPFKMEKIQPQTWRSRLEIKRGKGEWKGKVKRWVRNNFGRLKRIYHNERKEWVAANSDCYDAVAILLADFAWQNEEEGSS